MIRHMVLFRITETLSAEEKLARAQFLQSVFLSLRERIPEILLYDVGINQDPAPGAFDVAIYAEFKSWSDLRAYQAHPEHLRAVETAREVKKEKAVVDYETD